MCAAPLAPPPDNTSPTLGRAFTDVVSCEYAVAVNDRSSIAQSILNVLLISIFFILQKLSGSTKIEENPYICPMNDKSFDMNKRGWLIPILIVAVNALAVIVKWGSLPEILPAHFDLQGNAGGSMSRSILPLYPFASVAVCLIAYVVALKKQRLQTGMVILASGISLVLLLSVLVTLTTGAIPFFMLAEQVVLLAAVIAFAVSVVKSRKK